MLKFRIFSFEKHLQKTKFFYRKGDFMNLKKEIEKINTEINYLQESTEKKYLKKLLKESAKRLTELYLKEVEKWDNTKTATFIYRNNDIESFTLPIRKKDGKNYEVKAGKGREYYNSSPFNPDKISEIIVDGREYNKIEVDSYNGSSKQRLKIKAGRKGDSQIVYFYFVAGGNNSSEDAEIFFCYGYNKAAGVVNEALNPDTVLYPAEYAKKAEDYYNAGQKYYTCKGVDGSICYPMDMKGSSPGTMGEGIFEEMKDFFKNQGYDIPEEVNPGAFNDRGNLCRADVVIRKKDGTFEPISLKDADAINKDLDNQDNLTLDNVEFRYEEGDSIRVDLKNIKGVLLADLQFRYKGGRLSIVRNPVKGGKSQGYAITKILGINKDKLLTFRTIFLNEGQNFLKTLEISDIPEDIRNKPDIKKFLEKYKSEKSAKKLRDMFQNTLAQLRELMLFDYIEKSSELFQKLKDALGLNEDPLEKWSLLGIYYLERTYKRKGTEYLKGIPATVKGVNGEKVFQLTGGFLDFLQDIVNNAVEIKPLIDSTPVSIAEYK